MNAGSFALSSFTTLVFGSGALAQSATSTPAESAKPKPLSTPFRVCAGGDVTLGTNLDPKWARSAADTLWRSFGIRPDPDSIAPSLKPFLAGADLVLLNIEGAIGSGPAPRKCGPRSPRCFRVSATAKCSTVPRRLADLRRDRRQRRKQSRARCRTTRPRHYRRAPRGRGHSRHRRRHDRDRRRPRLRRHGRRARLHTDSATPDARDLRAVRRHVARAAEQFGVVIVTMHLGAEGPSAQRTRNATERFLTKINRGNPVGFADAAFAAGATSVVGDGPHVLRAAMARNRLALYSLGNLLTYGRSSFAEPYKWRRRRLRKHRFAARLCRTQSCARPWDTCGPGAPAGFDEARLDVVDSLSALDFPRSGVTSCRRRDGRKICRARPALRVGMR